MEFKASKDIRLDADFKKHSDNYEKYMSALRDSLEGAEYRLATWANKAKNEMWAIVFQHLLSLDQEIQRLNKELVFKDVT